MRINEVVRRLETRIATSPAGSPGTRQLMAARLALAMLDDVRETLGQGSTVPGLLDTWARVSDLDGITDQALGLVNSSRELSRILTNLPIETLSHRKYPTWGRAKSSNRIFRIARPE